MIRCCALLLCSSWVNPSLFPLLNWSKLLWPNHPEIKVQCGLLFRWHSQLSLSTRQQKDTLLKAVYWKKNQVNASVHCALCIVAQAGCITRYKFHYTVMVSSTTYLCLCDANWLATLIASICFGCCIFTEDPPFLIIRVESMNIFVWQAKKSVLINRSRGPESCLCHVPYGQLLRDLKYWE